MEKTYLVTAECDGSFGIPCKVSIELEASNKKDAISLAADVLNDPSCFNITECKLIAIDGIPVNEGR